MESMKRRYAAVALAFMLLFTGTGLVVAAGQGESAQGEADGPALTCWYDFTSKLITNASENLVFQEVEKRTGVKVEFLHPPAGEAQQQFNLMIASGEMTDMLRNPPSFPGGPEKALNGEYYMDLAPLVNTNGPNIKRILTAYPDIKRQTYTDSGKIWGLPQIQLAPEPPWSGPMMRGDWLQELGMQVPETISQWETMLTAFKEKIPGCEAPLLLTMFDWRWGSNCAFAGAYGASFGGRNLLWLNKNGNVVFGPSESGYRDFLALMRDWYAKGLIDQDFATRDAKSFSAMFTSGKAGVFISGYGDLGPFQAAGRTDDPDFSIVPTPMPVLNEGDRLHIRQQDPNVKDNRGVVTTTCSDPARAMKWFDYAYGDEGFLLFCYGVEGKTYTMKKVDDYGFDADFFPSSIRGTGSKPVFTDFMTKNPEGIDFWDLVTVYKVHNGPMLRNPLAYENDPAVYDAMEIWSESGADWVIPPVTLSEQESLRYAEIMSEVETYYKEMTLKFIMGIEPLTNFDAYLAQLKRLNVNEARDIQQAALTRYMNR